MLNSCRVGKNIFYDRIIKIQTNKNISTLSETNIDIAKSTYVINTRTGKVHTYNHGISIIQNKENSKETNESLETILRDERYDICHTCYAGLLVDKKIEKCDVELVEKYMRLYEFVQNDIDTCEFLMSIFIVSNWYVNNVYTYQGGLNTVSKINSDAKNHASENAQNRWEDYKSQYINKHNLANEQAITNKMIIPTTFNGNVALKNALYKCSLFENEFAKDETNKNQKIAIKNAENDLLRYDYKNNYVSDDCSKFAVAVYYHYLNKILYNGKVNNDKEIDLWYTGSFNFVKQDSIIIKYLTSTKKFELLNLKKITSKELNLEAGDLLYRKEKAHYEIINGNKKSITDIPGHVEFYIGNGKCVGWGKIQSISFQNKVFYKNLNGFYSNYIDDKNQPYTAIIRFVGR